MVPRYLFTSKVATKIAAPAITTTTITAMAMRTLRIAYVLSRPRVRLDDSCIGRVCLRNSAGGQRILRIFQAWAVWPELYERSSHAEIIHAAATAVRL